jgi:hypothetical protein
MLFLLIPSCGIEMVAPWTSSEYACKKAHNAATFIDNKGTNIRRTDWGRRHPVLPEEVLRLLKAYPTASS